MSTNRILCNHLRGSREVCLAGVHSGARCVRTLLPTPGRGHASRRRPLLPGAGLQPSERASPSTVAGHRYRAIAADGMGVRRAWRGAERMGGMRAVSGIVRGARTECSHSIA